MTKPEAMTDAQWNFQEMEREHGEEGANKIIADRLRELANIVEADGDPRVFSFEDSDDSKSFIFHYTLTLSYPWPG